MSQATLPPTTAARWSDPKRYLWLLGPAIPLIGAAVLAAYRQTQQSWLVWIAFFLVRAGYA